MKLGSTVATVGFLLGFLEAGARSVGEIEGAGKDGRFSDVVEQAKEAAVLVLVY